MMTAATGGGFGLAVLARPLAGIGGVGGLSRDSARVDLSP